MSALPGSPYKGLTAFEDSELDALLFFGRERCTAHERYATGRSPQMRFRIRRRFQSAIS